MASAEKPQLLSVAPSPYQSSSPPSFSSHAKPSAVGARRGHTGHRHDEAHCLRDRRAVVPPARNARALLSELRHDTHAQRLRHRRHGRHDRPLLRGATSTAKYTYDTTMEVMIEDCAPAPGTKTPVVCSFDEAVSLMGAVLPQLERWRTVQEKTRSAYGAEARARYGDEAIDAANETLLDMDPQTWNDMKELERAILGQLSIARRRRSRE